MNMAQKEEDMTKEEEDLNIIKDLVVGFLIVRSKAQNGISYISTLPLDISWDRFDGDNDIDPNEEIIGVIPAPQFSYRILGYFPPKDNKEEDSDLGSYEILGYEYQGVYHPKWEELLTERIKNHEYEKIKNRKK